MFRPRIQKGVLYAILPFFQESTEDIPKRKVKSETQLEPGFDRVMNIFRLSEDLEFSPEVNSVLILTFFGTAVGSIFGGTEQLRGVHERFKAENVATKFVNHMDATSQLQKRIAKDFVRGAVKWGPKIGLFTFLFGTTTTLLNVYTGKNHVLSYVVGGALTGLMFKAHLGVQGMISGFTVGSILGGMCGLMSVVITFVTGVSIHDVYSTHSSWIEMRQEEIRKHANSQVDDEAALVMNLYKMNREATDQKVEVEAVTPAN